MIDAALANVDLYRQGNGVLQPSFVLFSNRTARVVNVYWVDNGNEILYLTLEPRRADKVNTFLTHQWIFRDQTTGERMHVAQSDTFWPECYRMPDPRNSLLMIPCRKQVIIHFPMRTLRENCLWQIIHGLQNLGTEEALKVVKKMSIPYTLRNDLTLLLQELQAYKKGNTVHPLR